ncbi:uncharacterized protein Dvar_17510 [Desulfosarcina variabilis str. Montpellier]
MQRKLGNQLGLPCPHGIFRWDMNRALLAFCHSDKTCLKTTNQLSLTNGQFHGIFSDRGSESISVFKATGKMETYNITFLGFSHLCSFCGYE